jgi:hypothetical protein
LTIPAESKAWLDRERSDTGALTVGIKRDRRENACNSVDEISVMKPPLQNLPAKRI